MLYKCYMCSTSMCVVQIYVLSKTNKVDLKLTSSLHVSILFEENNDLRVEIFGFGDVLLFCSAGGGMDYGVGCGEVGVVGYGEGKERN